MAELSGGTVVPRGYLIECIAQFMHESNVPLSEIAEAFETAAVNQVGSGENGKEEAQIVVESVRKGQWDLALEPILSSISDPVLVCDILEHMIHHLVRRGASESASTLLTRVSLLAVTLKKQDPSRYASLKQYVENGVTLFESDNAEESDRLKLATRVEECFAKRKSTGSTPAKPQLQKKRLISLIEDACKWQKVCGKARFEWDTPRDEKQQSIDVAKTASSLTAFKAKAASAKFGKGVKVQYIAASSDGKFLCTGTDEGLVEILNADTLKLSKDLPYQKTEDILLVEHPVSSIAFSLAGDLLAVGDVSGQLSIFTVATGKLKVAIATGHKRGVSALCFSPDGARVVSGGVNGACRLFSTASGARLCDFVGHESFINTIAFEKSTQLITASSDGKLCFWNANTGEQLRVVTPTRSKIIRVMSFQDVAKSNVNAEAPPTYLRFGEMTSALVVSPSSVVAVSLEASAQTTAIFTRPAGDIVDAVLSRNGASMFCWTQDGKLHEIDMATKGVKAADKISIHGHNSPSSPLMLCPAVQGHFFAAWSALVARV